MFNNLVNEYGSFSAVRWHPAQLESYVRHVRRFELFVAREFTLPGKAPLEPKRRFRRQLAEITGRLKRTLRRPHSEAPPNQ